MIYCTDDRCDPNALAEKLACHSVVDTPEGPSKRSWFVHRGNASDATPRELVAHAHSVGQPDFKGLGWTVLVKHDAAEVFAPVAQLRYSVLLPSAAISIVALILGLLVARSVARPIQTLADAALQISRGDLDIDLAIESNDEIGHLASCFGQMSRQLKVMIERLHVEIEDRKKVERNLESVNAQLTSTVIQLRSTNRDIQDFTKAAAHDLKTPVRGIATLAEWLLADYGDRLDESGVEQLRLLLGRARRSMRLLDGMLDYARAGRVDERVGPVDVERLVSEIADWIVLPPHMDLRVDARCSTIMASENTLRRVLSCLIHNAIRYMDKPRGRIIVTSVEEGDFVKFSVADNGPGIDTKYHEKIFHLFQTLDTREENESAGIGLCIAKKIVELYAGRIWIESQPGQGATFHFTWPRQSESLSILLESLATTAS